MNAEPQPGWYRDAGCIGADPDIFFTQTDYRPAKAICAGCTVRTPCLEYALQHHSTSAGADLGVWGGLSPAERRQLLRRQRRA